jgi:hypothetical protein
MRTVVYSLYRLDKSELYGRLVPTTGTHQNYTVGTYRLDKSELYGR